MTETIGTTIKHWNRSETMYTLTLSARYICLATGKVSGIIETHSKLTDTKTLITSELECIEEGARICQYRYDNIHHWDIEEVFIEQWVRYCENPKRLYHDITNGEIATLSDHRSLWDCDGLPESNWINHLKEDLIPVKENPTPIHHFTSCNMLLLEEEK